MHVLYSDLTFSTTGADESQNWDTVMFLVSYLEMILTGLTLYQTTNFQGSPNSKDLHTKK